MAETASEVTTCSKCRQNPRADADGSNPWCKECRAEYQRAYVSGKDAKARCEGFAAGATAMRRAAAVKLAQVGPFARLTGAEAAGVVQQIPSPTPET